MSEPVAVDLFVEDRAHEAFLGPIVHRVAREEGVAVHARIRSARGGHGRAIEELKLYQSVMALDPTSSGAPALVIVGIDANCKTYPKAREAVQAEIRAGLADRVILACPDPHVERWYLADPISFETVVGFRPAVGKAKCARDYYKNLLAKSVRHGGHPPTLLGLEFAAELVEAMDLYRAGKNDHSLRAFVDELRTGLRRIGVGR
ncbi:MAG: hypothetical protein KA072_11470 [Thermoanaerobaculaceae bacterium]|nr:hypothetical protein [Thermoanaerobaculaceae bacterium]MDI9622136.1 hypothetical protein [Acidobacteriota bacterium]NLH12103.1 hypothetical protein [Holophagae bacterium]HPW56134.1 hypothetical protein [Thermoanaerobaculaceae bacterium]